jgi:glycosyltransferase involved in cell wall biosynthesis
VNVWFVLSAPKDLMGGGEIFAIRLGGWFRSRGHRVDVVVRPGSKVGEAAKASFLHVRTLAMRNDFDFFSRMQLERWFKAEHSTVVFGGWGRDIKLAGPAAQRNGARLFWMFGAPGAAITTRHKRLDKKFVSGYIVYSDFARRELVESDILPPEKIRVTYPAIDPEKFAPDHDTATRGEQFRLAYRIPASAPIVLCMSRFVETKGHDVLLRAWAHVVQSCPDALLILTGDGPLYSVMQGLSRELAVEGSVRFIGHVPDVRPALWNADIMILPSRVEPLGMVALEAMAAGVPVIASNVGGIPEAVQHDRSGLLVEPGNDSDLAQAILRLPGDQTLRMKLVEGGRTRLKSFLPDACFAPLEKLITNASDESSSSPGASSLP